MAAKKRFKSQSQRTARFAFLNASVWILYYSAFRRLHLSATSAEECPHQAEPRS